MEPFLELVAALDRDRVRFVLIGVAGANYFAPAPSATFVTRDRDLFLPPDAENLLAAWRAADAAGFDLSCSGETLDIPRDLWLARQVVARRALTRAFREPGPQIDLSLVMAGFEFESVWRDHRVFVDTGVEVPVARLMHIVTSKALAGRPKDHLFLATHAEALRELLPKDEGSADAT